MRLFSLIIPTTLAIVFSIAVSAKEPTVIPGIEMVDVEGGTFTMGLDEDEAEHMYETPKHEVTLSDFRIGKYEVTQELWEAVMGGRIRAFPKEMNYLWKMSHGTMCRYS